jgi:hypothetical protein
MAELRAWCEDHGKIILLESPRAQWPPADENDMSSGIFWTVLEQLAQIRIRTIKKKYADTRSFLHQNKALTGRICWGFMTVGKTEGSGKTAIPNPRCVRYLIGMIEMAEAGKTNYEIAEWLDEQAVKDENALPKYRGTWAPNSVGDILRNESLYGVWRENGKALVHHEGIITKDRWDALQRKLNAKPSRRGPTRNDSMMLSDSIYCARCDGIMHQRHHDGWLRKDGTRTVYHYYRCDGKPKPGQRSTCRNTIPAAGIEEWVSNALTQKGGLFSYADQELKQLIYVPARGHADEIQEIDDEIDALDRNDPNYRVEWARLMDERDKLIALGTEPAHTEEFNTGILLRDFWRMLTKAGKRHYLIMAGVKVYAYRDEERRIEGDPSRVHGALTLNPEVFLNTEESDFASIVPKVIWNDSMIETPATFYPPKTSSVRSAGPTP